MARNRLDRIISVIVEIETKIKDPLTRLRKWRQIKDSSMNLHKMAPTNTNNRFYACADKAAAPNNKVFMCLEKIEPKLHNYLCT